MFLSTRFRLLISGLFRIEVVSRVVAISRIEVMSFVGRRSSRCVASTTSSAAVTSATSLNDDDRTRVVAVSRIMDPRRRIIDSASKVAGRDGSSEVTEVDRIWKEALVFVHLKEV